jgi:hypothetical protein
VSFDPIAKSVTHDWYAQRSLQKLPGDVLEACDQIRSQKKEINQLRHDLLEANKAKLLLGIKNVALVAILGGAAAKGIEVGVLSLIKLFAR